MTNLLKIELFAGLTEVRLDSSLNFFANPPHGLQGRHR